MIKPKGRKHSQILQDVGWEVVASYLLSFRLLPVQDAIQAPCPFSTPQPSREVGLPHYGWAKRGSPAYWPQLAGVGGGAVVFCCDVIWSRVVTV